MRFGRDGKEGILGLCGWGEERMSMVVDDWSCVDGFNQVIHIVRPEIGQSS